MKIYLNKDHGLSSREEHGNLSSSSAAFKNHLLLRAEQTQNFDPTSLLVYKRLNSQ